jgi:hypothetical protein
LEGWIPDVFYGENGLHELGAAVFQHLIRYSEAEKLEMLNSKVNAEVVLEPNPDSTEESYKITAVFEGKTLIFENCKPKKHSQEFH